MDERQADWYSANRMKTRPPMPGTFRFIFIAVVLMLLVDHYVFGGKREYIEDARSGAVQEQQATKNQQDTPARAVPGDGKDFFEATPMEEPTLQQQAAPNTPVPSEGAVSGAKTENGFQGPAGIITDEQQTASLPPAPDGAKGNAAPGGKGETETMSMGARPRLSGRPMVAIVIDDLGMDVRRTKRVMYLPQPITLAFLPYAPKTAELAREGKAKGHSLIIHTPMEATDGRLNIGPGGLKVSMQPEALDTAFAAMMKSFEGYEGINNHMGSRMTQNRPAMDRIMRTLAANNLFFLDSKTAGRSVGARAAAAAGVPYAERDVFLDHVDSAEFVRKALAHTEQLALRRGYAIAIGHPKDHTIAGLQAWIPTLEAKGIELVPVKRLLIHPSRTQVAESGEDKGAPRVIPAAARDGDDKHSPTETDVVQDDTAEDVSQSEKPALVALTPEMVEKNAAETLDMFPDEWPSPAAGMDTPPASSAAPTFSIEQPIY